MKTKLYLTSILFLSLFSCNKPTGDEVPFATPRGDEIFNLTPDSCVPRDFASSPLHEKHLLFAKLIAIACGQSSDIRTAIKSASFQQGTSQYKEVLVSDFLDDSAGNTTVYNLLAAVFTEAPIVSGSVPFSEYINDLLASDPLLVLKIPDWFDGASWDIAQTAPWVVSNTKATDQHYYGFDPNGNCFSKSKVKTFFALELMVKTSEDYLWASSVSFVNGFANYCMSYNDFNQQYSRAYFGGVLYNRKDLQKLFLGCDNDPDEPQASPPPPNECLRDQGFDFNYMRGFRLSNEGVSATLDNQPCLDGEETFDFQIDFLYANRTAELEALGLQLLPLPVYGLRASDLVTQQTVAIGTITTIFGTKTIYEVQNVPKYYSFGIGPLKFNYTKLIDPSVKEWDRAGHGEQIFVAWHETDFEICTSQGVTTVQNNVSTQQQVNFSIQFAPGTTIGGNQQFNESLQKTFQFTLTVKGDAVIPLGYNGLGYCDPPNPFASLVFFYPTGPSGLLVDYSHCLQQ